MEEETTKTVVSPVWIDVVAPIETSWRGLFFAWIKYMIRKAEF